MRRGSGCSCRRLTAPRTSTAPSTPSSPSGASSRSSSEVNKVKRSRLAPLWETTPRTKTLDVTLLNVFTSSEKGPFGKQLISRISTENMLLFGGGACAYSWFVEIFCRNIDRFLVFYSLFSRQTKVLHIPFLCIFIPETFRFATFCTEKDISVFVVKIRSGCLILFCNRGFYVEHFLSTTFMCLF